HRDVLAGWRDIAEDPFLCSIHGPADGNPISLGDHVVYYEMAVGEGREPGDQLLFDAGDARWHPGWSHMIDDVWRDEPFGVVPVPGIDHIVEDAADDGLV